MKRCAKITTLLFFVFLCFCSFAAPHSKKACSVVASIMSPHIVEAKTKKTYTYELENKKLDNFININAKLGGADLAIKASKDDSFYLSYHIHCYNSKNPVDYQAGGNALQLSAERLDNALYTYKRGKHIISRVNKTKITLYVPEKQLNLVNLQAEDADLSLRDLSCRNISVSITDGSIGVSGIKSFQAMQLQARDGDISLSGFDAKGSMSAKTRYGYITASKIRSYGATKMISKDGDINLSDFSEYGSMQIKTRYGYIIGENITLPGSVGMTTKSGDIKLSGLHITGSTKLYSTDGYITLSMDHECLRRLGITMKTEVGNMSVGTSIGGQKRRYKPYGWKYIKSGSANGPMINAVTKNGNISLQ